jgi:pimeloyl-ACP methyl ester carboxylesterase
MVPVGGPAAQLSVATLEPGDYHFTYALDWKIAENGSRRPIAKQHWEALDPAEPKNARMPLGTILVLHGFYDCKELVAHWALFLAEAGYRTVLVDLRGHGRSTGEWIGYGAFEAKDLSQVLDDLDRKQLITGKVGLLGVSYGASVGLQLAARDKRIATVVALEPFCDAQKAVVEFSHSVAGSYVKDWTADDFSSALTKAAKLANFSWSDVDVMGAVEKTTVPILFIHGARDKMISPEHSRVLKAHAAGQSTLLILPDDDHILLSKRLAPIAQGVAEWFDKNLGVMPIAAVAANRSP